MRVPIVFLVLVSVLISCIDASASDSDEIVDKYNNTVRSAGAGFEILDSRGELIGTSSLNKADSQAGSEGASSDSFATLFSRPTSQCNGHGNLELSPVGTVCHCNPPYQGASCEDYDVRQLIVQYETMRHNIAAFMDGVVNLHPQACVLPFRDDFSNRARCIFNQDGLWAIVGGELEGTGVCRSTVKFTGGLPFSYDAVVDTVIISDKKYHRNSYFIIDYVDERNFKFAGMNVDKQQFEVGRVDSKEWLAIAYRPESIQADKHVSMMVQVRDLAVTLVVNGVAKVSYSFTTSLNRGKIGLGSNDGHVRFDNLTVSRTDVSAIPVRGTTLISAVQSSGTARSVTTDSFEKDLCLAIIKESILNIEAVLHAQDKADDISAKMSALVHVHDQAMDRHGIIDHAGFTQQCEKYSSEPDVAEFERRLKSILDSIQAAIAQTMTLQFGDLSGSAGITTAEEATTKERCINVFKAEIDSFENTLKQANSSVAFEMNVRAVLANMDNILTQHTYTRDKFYEECGPFNSSIDFVTQSLRKYHYTEMLINDVNPLMLLDPPPLTPMSPNEEQCKVILWDKVESLKSQLAKLTPPEPTLADPYFANVQYAVAIRQIENDVLQTRNQQPPPIFYQECAIFESTSPAFADLWVSLGEQNALRIFQVNGL